MKINSIWVEWNLIVSDDSLIKKVWIIWCWSHVYRNIIPALRFVEWHEIIATCDLNIEKAKLFAKKNWASYYYSDYNIMLNKNDFYAIIIVVGYDKITWKPLYPSIAKDILKKWINVWMEKPPADNWKELKNLKNIALLNNCFFQTWFKMMFSPTIKKVKEMFLRKNFISPQSFYITYAVDMPKDIRDLTIPWNRRFLDDIVHVFSQLHFLFWKPKEMKYLNSWKKDWFINLKYWNNLTWIIHVQWWISIIWPAEYARIIWEWSFIEITSWIKIRYHNYWNPWSYWRDISYLRKDNTFTEEYSPELRQPLWALSLHSEALFWYINEFKYFFSTKDWNWVAWMQDSIDIMNVYDWLSIDEDVWFNFNDSDIRYEKNNNILIKQSHLCDKCDNYMHIKDGWTFSCWSCWSTIQLISNDIIKFSSNYDKIIHYLNWTLSWIKWIELINSSNSKINYERIYTNITLNDYNLWWKFSIYKNDKLILNEVSINEKINSKPFLSPNILYSNEYGIIFEKINWRMLSDLLEKNLELLFVENSTLHKLVLNIIMRLANFHKNNSKSGIIHNDFDPFNIMISDDFNDVYLLDWEFAKVNWKEHIDLLHFLFMIVFIYYKDYHKKDILIKFESNLKLVNLFHNLLDKYVLVNSIIDLSDINNLIYEYASIKCNEIDDSKRNQKQFMYKYISEYDFSFLNLK